MDALATLCCWGNFFDIHQAGLVIWETTLAAGDNLKIAIHVLLLLSLAEMSEAKNLFPSEPGTVRGCAWLEGDGPGPVPDLIGDTLQKAEVRAYKIKVKVIGEKPSPDHRRGIVIEQDPPRCSVWPSKLREINVTLSSGKSKVRDAFVEIPGKGFVGFDMNKHGQPRMVAGQCVTSKGNLRIFDIGSPLAEPVYDKAACAQEMPYFRSGSSTLKITPAVSSPQLKRSKGSSTPRMKVTIVFMATEAGITDLEFAHHLTTYFQPINAGFKVISGQVRPEGPRVYKRLAKGESMSLPLFIEADPDTRLGDHWVTFAFLNLAGVRNYQATEPVKIRVIE
jgi:hypothetical protein